MNSEYDNSNESAPLLPPEENKADDEDTGKMIKKESAELRENVPLNKREKEPSACRDCFGGSRLITASFLVFTAAITIGLAVQIRFGDYQTVPHGSVATDSRECSAIGVDALRSGGNAVDAVVASALCLSVVSQHSTGLDASGSVMVYNHRSREIPTVYEFGSGVDSPRLVSGLARVHSEVGRLSWRDVVLPSAKLAAKGFLVPEAATKGGRVPPEITSFNQAGRKIRLPQMAKVFDRIADESETELGSGGGVSKRRAFRQQLGAFDVFSSGDPLTAAALERLEGRPFSRSPDYIYWLAGELKDAFESERFDEKYRRGSTSSVAAAMDDDDLYVSLVSGLGARFGSRNLSLDNYYYYDKTDDSRSIARTPLIVIEKNRICGRRIVTGVGDASVAAQLVAALVVGGENATSAVERPRFLLSDDGRVAMERPEETTDSCNIVEKVADELQSHSDSRGGGVAYRF